MKLIFVIFFVFLSAQISTQSETCDLLASWVTEAEVSPECMKQLQIVCNNGSLLWRMFDASSKYPNTGMSYSNNKDLGSYDECINLKYEGFEGTVKGKYCGLSVAIVNIFLDPIPNPFKLEIKRKPLALYPKINRTVRADLTEEYSISALSVCVPEMCTPKEVGLFFLWGRLNDPLPLVNFVDEIPCMTIDSNTDFKWGDILYTTVLSIIGLLVVWSTAYDFMLQKLQTKPRNPIFLAFSVITNGKKLLTINTNTSYDQIQCLNGLRFISMMWVIAGHNFIAMEDVPLINYVDVRRQIDNVKIQYASAAPIAVDTFFFLSGFLLCFGYLKTAAKWKPTRQLAGIPMMVIHRYLRLTPALAMLYFASITIFRMLGTGPLWGIVSTQLRDQCENHWWDFFLYIQNYVSYDDMCLNHTWYLSADMQMFILAPIVLIPIAMLIKENKTNHAIIGLCVLIVAWVIIPIGIRFADQITDNVYETHSRFNDYLIGVLLGVIMRDLRFRKFPFSKLVNLTIWCVVLNICVAFNLYYHNVIRIYDHTSYTLFYGLYRPIWCLSLAWMVYSCHHGYGGVINWLLSLPMFQVGARLSYSMYLLHAVVEMYWVGVIRTPYYWGDYAVFYNWCGHFIVTMILSTVWSLAFESPMIVIEKFLFGGGGKTRQPKKEVAQA